MSSLLFCFWLIVGFTCRIYKSIRYQPFCQNDKVVWSCKVVRLYGLAMLFLLMNCFLFISSLWDIPCKREAHLVFGELLS